MQEGSSTKRWQAIDYKTGARRLAAQACAFERAPAKTPGPPRARRSVEGRRPFREVRRPDKRSLQSDGRTDARFPVQGPQRDKKSHRSTGGLEVVGPGGLEPPTPAVSGRCSPTELRAYACARPGLGTPSRSPRPVNGWLDSVPALVPNPRPILRAVRVGDPPPQGRSRQGLRGHRGR